MKKRASQMPESPTEIGAYGAKTRLPELLRLVQAGQRFTITNRGEAVADLVPCAVARVSDAAAAIDRFRAFMASHPVTKPDGVGVRALIDEGRE
jgi:antitoxin (DNA-binding transcriptional repressor) of toxin-antitoxin stability system